jgi:hypothetical protein
MAMSFEEAQRLTNQNLAKQRKGYLAENAYRQSPEGIQRSKDRVKAIGKGALELTPYATYTDGKSAIENFKKGEYLDAAIDTGFAGLGALGLAPLAKAGKAGYKSLNQANKYRKFKNEAARRGGPLSPHYMEKMTGNPRVDRLANQNVANMRSTITDKDYPYTNGVSELEIALKNMDSKYKDARFGFTGQNENVAYDIADLIPPKDYGGKRLFLGKEPPVASNYAIKAAKFKKRTDLNDPPVLESRGKLVAIPFHKDFPLPDYFDENLISGNYMNITERVNGRDIIKSVPNPRIMGREELTIPIDKIAELRKHVIGGRGLILPPGAGKDASTMNTVARLIREGKYRDQIE